MIGLLVLISLVSSSFADLADDPPKYVQARNSFQYVKAYISQNLPPKHNGVRDKSFSLGVLVGTTGALAYESYNNSKLKPIEVVDKYVPYTWRHYSDVQSKCLSLLNDATIKTSLISNLIDSICGSVSVTECNQRVEEKVRSSPLVLAPSARLLLALGDVSSIIIDNSNKIDILTGRANVVPYLLNNVNGRQLKDLVKKLEIAYSLLLSGKLEDRVRKGRMQGFQWILNENPEFTITAASTGWVEGRYKSGTHADRQERVNDDELEYNLMHTLYLSFHNFR